MSNFIEKIQELPQKTNHLWTLRHKIGWGLLLALFLSLFTASTSRAWPAANLNVPRRGHTSTLLHDGRILVIGGHDHLPNEPITDTTVVEIYNPLTNSWTLAANLPVGRTHHTATLLPDGRVLVAGGSTSGEIQAFTNLYDPKIDSWTEAADLSVARALHTATLLTDGRVLVTGGYSGDGGFVTSHAEIYDSDTDSWFDADNMNFSRNDHSATLLGDGRVVVIGGNGNGDELSSVEIYNPITDSWSQAEPSDEAHDGHAATLLPDGRILVMGGNKENYEISATVELYDPITNSWSSGASLNEARIYHSAALLPNGTVLVVGGEDRSDFPDSVEQYDPYLDVWTTVASLAEPRADQTMTLLPDGRVIVVGGYSPERYSVWSVEIFNPFTSSWLPATSPDYPRSLHTTTMLPNGRLLVTGGGAYHDYQTDTAELYYPESDSWSSVPNMSSRRLEHTATMLPNNKVLIVGGRDSSQSGYLSTTETYDPMTNTWTASASFETARDRHTATLLQNGSVLIAGGYGDIDNTSTALNSAELYDFSTDTWVAGSNLNTARYWGTATRLHDGHVMVIGGRDIDNRVTTSTEIYDPDTNSWHISADLTIASSGHTATLLSNGCILVAGGRESNNGYATDRVELYDPTNDTWNEVASLTTPRLGHTATLLHNGQVLVVGGYGSSAISSAELYDPATDSWTAISDPTTKPFDHSANLLPNGQILIVGGREANESYASAELFDLELGFDEAWRPEINTITNPMLLGTAMEITGNQFRGISDASGGGSFNDSATDYPLVQLRSLVNDQLMWLHPAAGMGWSSEYFTSTAVTDFPIGPALVTIFTNAIPSQSAFIQVVNAEHTLTVNADGGSVASLPEGIDCGVDCSETFAYGTAVTLTATAETGYMFSNWSGACSGNGDCVLTLDIDKDVTAHFIPIQYEVTVEQNGTGSGLVSSTPEGINCQPDCSEAYIPGTVITLTAVPDTGSTFTGWTGDCGSTDDCVLTINNQDLDVSANFTLEKFTASVDIIGTGGGSVSSTPAGIDCELDCSETYSYGTVITLTAVADTGSTFTSWSGDCIGTDDCVITLNADKNITATFTLDRHMLTVNKNGAGSGSVISTPTGINCGSDCDEVYVYGAVITLTATADTDASFTGWHGACSGTGVCVVTMDETTNVTATFMKYVLFLPVILNEP